jgi:hypothetical protein
MKRKHWLLVLAMIATTLLASNAYAHPPPQAISPGTLVALRGTPHLWVGGDDGALHWAGDTRALANRVVDWSSRREVSQDELRGMRRGDPWLSAGLVKLGDPIYLAKWETSDAAPTLLHIQSIADVELFGINASNYGQFVLDRATWEQRYGFNTDTLARGVLPPAVPPTSTPTPAVTATPQVRLAARVLERTRVDSNNFRSKIEVSGALPRVRINVSNVNEEWICSPECTDTRRSSWGPREAGVTNNEGKLEYTDEHGPYKQSRYTFEDPAGNRVTIELDDDRGI